MTGVRKRCARWQRDQAAICVGEELREGPQSEGEMKKRAIVLDLV